jgi:3-oxoadipate enol-lactonase
MWERQLNQFQYTCRSVAYDVRGHGNTKADTGEYSIPQFTNDLFDLITALKIENPILCGLSMGGYIALHAIALHPEKIAGLILSDTQCMPDTDEVRDKRMKAIASIEQNGFEQYASDTVKNLFAPSSFENKKEEIAFIKETILMTTPDSVCKTLMALANRKEKCSILPKLSVPVLILVGEADKVTPVAAAKKMHELIKGSDLHVIPGAGHLSNLENTPEFNRHLSDFLNK